MWDRVGHGLYLRVNDVDHSSMLAAWQQVLPVAAGFTGLTAAESYGWWLPSRLDDAPIFVAMHEGATPPKRRGLRVARLAMPPALLVRDGLQLTAPADTLLACARELGLLDLVVLCDAALHLESCSLAELKEVAAPGRRGSPALRRALALADGRSESAWESVLRLLHVSCGVHVEPQYVLRDSSGGFVARGDLWLVGTRTFHEYDGDVHRTPRQLRADLLRDRRILDAGWTRRGFTSPDVLFHASAILREADAALGRTSRPGRIRAWHRLLADSMLTPAGAERLRQRWTRGRADRPAA